MKNRIFDEKSMLKLLKFTKQNKTINGFGLIVYLFKRLNVFNLSAVIKNFFVNSFMAEVPII